MSKSSDPPSVPPSAADNQLRSLPDLQRALSDAAALGFADNDRPGSGRPRRTGSWVAARLCAPGAWTKRHERYLKIAYLAGYDFAVTVGRGIARRARKS